MSQRNTRTKTCNEQLKCRRNEMTKSKVVTGCALSLALTAGLGACSNDNTDSASGLDPATDQMINQLQSELDNAPAVDSRYKNVKPIFKCVEKVNSSTYKAHFGYSNSNSTAVPIPVGFYNRFWPGAINRGQPTTFQPGTFSDVVQVTFPSYSAS